MHYTALNDYLRARFGRKVYKLSLQGVSTCPNRDGTVGSRGCIFCSDTGSGEFAACGSDLSAQIRDARRRVAEKVPPDAGYIAYFQSFTNTYAPVKVLRPLFAAAMVPEDVVAISIATRPDCLSEEVLDLLAELNEHKPVWVELGLQTIHESTARYIRRGYDLSVFNEAVGKLKARGIEVIVHQIIGLPGESEKQIYDTADHIARSGADGVKFHLLHVLRGTDLAADYEAGQFKTLSMEDYFRLLCGCIERMPQEMVIHRLTGDGAKRDLISPLWSADKKRVLNALRRYMDEHDVQQGRYYGG
ncbi:MAG: TIGR01212 family radical SAM protein [Oscillospiraceae bacterium]|nr:TIGR01212 family radical SAM protein [Oscillospiraceae bacterium]